MGQVFLLSLTAALNPVLVGASTVMLLLPNPKRLMLGYLLGALMTSITLGLVIVFALKGSGTVSTTQNTINPAVDLALGALLLTAAFVLGTGRDKQITERRQARKGPKEDKGPPRWQQALSKGSARDTFVVGALLTLPGASYLAGLHHIEDQRLSTTATVLTVVGFNLIMLILLELPLLGYVVAPDWTPGAVERAKAWVGRNGHQGAVQRAKAWVGRNGHQAAVIALTVLGAALLIKGIAGLVS
jgi:Sap, sulfolipid-1-addressing protein